MQSQGLFRIGQVVGHPGRLRVTEVDQVVETEGWRGTRGILPGTGQADHLHRVVAGQSARLGNH